MRARFLKSLEALFFLFALVSLAYAITVALRRGTDVALAHTQGRAWLDGLSQKDLPIFYGYPPYAVVVFSLLALLSLRQAIIAMLIINLAATALCLHFIWRLWGAEWPIRTRLHLAALLLSWSSFRVTFGNGQLSLIVMALLLGAILAGERKKKIVAGFFLSLALCKYTLSFPFLLYFAWKREWKILIFALTPLLPLTQVYASRLGSSALAMTADYLYLLRREAMEKDAILTGVTEIKPLILSLTGGHQTLSAALTVALCLVALICMIVVFKRSNENELIKLSILALFGLWSVYHRTYDLVLCLLPAALFIDLLTRKNWIGFSLGWLAALGLLIINIPGLLVYKLRLSGDSLATPLGLIGLHSERIMIFAMFWSLLFLLWTHKKPSSLRSVKERKPI